MPEDNVHKGTISPAQREAELDELSKRILSPRVDLIDYWCNSRHGMTLTEREWHRKDAANVRR